jgi:cytochrome b
MEKESEIKVWDLFVRVFHWLLVAGFFTAYLVEDELLGLHIWSGYLAFSLVVLRIAWGFIGSRHARFRDFIYAPGAVIGYLRQIISFSSPRHIGHNPAGGAMILLLLASLLATGFSGMILFGAETQAGMLSDLATTLGIVGEHATESFEEVHEFCANLTLLLVIMHVGGVLFESLLHRENLVRSMFTGRKHS